MRKQLHVYFGNKEKFFGAVLERYLVDVYESVPFTPENLPNYAERLFDFCLEQPDLVRLLGWLGLEQQTVWAGQRQLDLESKLQGVLQAQGSGTVTSEFTPRFIVTL